MSQCEPLALFFHIQITPPCGIERVNLLKAQTFWQYFFYCRYIHTVHCNWHGLLGCWTHRLFIIPLSHFLRWCLNNTLEWFSLFYFLKIFICLRVVPEYWCLFQLVFLKQQYSFEYVKLQVQCYNEPRWKVLGQLGTSLTISWGNSYWTRTFSRK